MNIPYSALFDDIYYSREGGMDESNHVFIQGNKLLDRWSNHSSHIYKIGETGFGTGLNFLLTWCRWQEFNLRKPTTNLRYLHFISVEKYPLSKDDIRNYLMEFPLLRYVLNELLDKYHVPCPGYYRFHFPKDRIYLQLLIGDALENLREFNSSIHSWYLDGFNPKKNPDLWNEDILTEITRLSEFGTGLATFTSSSFVRRSLESLGWKIEKIPGYGRKREMSIGTYQGSKTNDRYNSKLNFNSTNINYTNHRSIHILGAGIAGASTAYALSLRGIHCRVYDNKGIAQNASGNPIGIFYPYLTKYPTPYSKFSIQAFLYANSFLVTEGKKAIAREGLIFLLRDTAKKERYLKSIQSFALPEEIVKFQEDNDRLFFPMGKAISPKIFVQRLLELSNAEFIQENINYKNESSNIHIHCQSYDINTIPSFMNGYYPRIKKVRGQLAYIPSSILENPPNHPICESSYLTPWDNESYIAGSTYDEFNPDRGWDSIDEDKIFNEINKLSSFKNELNFSEWKNDRQIKIKESIQSGGSEWEGDMFRVSHRAQARDRFPVVGIIPEGLTITSLGSKGLVSGMLAGEIIASILMGEPSPVPFSVEKGISPSRFVKNPSNKVQ